MFACLCVCMSVPVCLYMSVLKVAGTDAPHVRLAVNLFTIVVLGVLENRADINESVVSKLVPCIAKGLQSRNVDFRAAAYIGLGQLSVKVALDGATVTTLLDELTKVCLH